MKFVTNAKQRCFQAQKKVKTSRNVVGFKSRRTALCAIKDLVSSQQKVGEKFLYFKSV